MKSKLHIVDMYVREEENPSCSLSERKGCKYLKKIVMRRKNLIERKVNDNDKCRRVESEFGAAKKTINFLPLAVI